MLKLKNFLLLILATCLHLVAVSQPTTNDIAGEGGFMRSEGKVYVVVAVVITILLGLIIYVARVDRKLTRLEKQGNH